PSATASPWALPSMSSACGCTSAAATGSAPAWMRRWWWPRCWRSSPTRAPSAASRRATCVRSWCWRLRCWCSPGCCTTPRCTSVTSRRRGCASWSCSPPPEARSVQKAELRNAALRADEHLAVGDGRGDELVAGAELVATAACLRAVIQLVRQVTGVVGVQHRGVGALVCPDDAVAAAVGRDCRSRARVAEAGRGAPGQARAELVAGDREGHERTA